MFSYAKKSIRYILNRNFFFVPLRNVFKKNSQRHKKYSIKDIYSKKKNYYFINEL